MSDREQIVTTMTRAKEAFLRGSRSRPTHERIATKACPTLCLTKAHAVVMIDA